MADILDELGVALLDELSGIITDELGLTVVAVSRGLLRLGLVPKLN